MVELYLLVLTGWPSDGKTNIAKMLRDFGFEYLSTDAVRRKLYPGKAPLDIPYPEGWEPIWDEIRMRRDVTLLSGKNVVIDSCAQNNYIRDKFFSLDLETKLSLKAKGAHLHKYLIKLCVNDDVRLQRELARGRNLDDMLKIIDAMKSDYQDPANYKFEDVLFLEYPNNTFDDQAKILEHIKSLCGCSSRNIWNKYISVKKRKKSYAGKIVVSGEDHRANLEQIIKPHINKSTVMLDEGCGIADHLLLYSMGAKKIYGIDTCTELILEARKSVANRPEIEIMWMDINDLEFDNNTFDIITNVFAPQTKKSCEEVYRTLKKGGLYVRVTGAGEFVEYNGKLLKRPQDIIGRGMFIDKMPKQILTEETHQVKSAGFSFVKVNEFQGIKIFKTMEDAISYLRESGHFVFSEPFAPLSEDEVQKIVNNKAEFEITCHNEKVIGVPYDSLLIIARKS